MSNSLSRKKAKRPLIMNRAQPGEEMVQADAPSWARLSPIALRNTRGAVRRRQHLSPFAHALPSSRRSASAAFFHANRRLK